ncbi:MAG: allophanate hydrolase [Nocardioides sp.]|nr:allophanate hydrolase [Nocardioides sp.]
MRPVGPYAVLVEVGGPREALALVQHLQAHGPRATDLVPAARTVLVDGLDGPGARRSLEDAVAAWTPPRDADMVSSDVPVVTVPVVYDGPDLETVAELWDTDLDGVVGRHAGTPFTSAFCGFAPGFAYLTGLPEHLAVPRLATPRERVPAGSVALAGPWCGVYPTASPGGWQLIGRTDLTLFDPTADPPALLAPGTRVRFEPA